MGTKNFKQLRSIIRRTYKWSTDSWLYFVCPYNLFLLITYLPAPSVIKLKYAEEYPHLESNRNSVPFFYWYFYHHICKILKLSFLLYDLSLLQILFWNLDYMNFLNVYFYPYTFAPNKNSCSSQSNKCQILKATWYAWENCFHNRK